MVEFLLKVKCEISAQIAYSNIAKISFKQVLSTHLLLKQIAIPFGAISDPEITPLISPKF